MLIASAPRASAATRPRPSPQPPDAITGIDTASTAAGNSTAEPTSSSPGCPAHSNPSMLTASTPSDSAFTACLTDVHLCTTTAPDALSAGMSGSGELPAVSNTRTPSPSAASR